MLCYNQRTVIFRMRRGCQSSDDENVRYYRLVNGSKCLPAPFQKKSKNKIYVVEKANRLVLKTSPMVFGLFRLEVGDHHNHLAVGAAPRCYYCWELMLLVLQHNNLYCCCLRIYPKMSMQEKSGFKGLVLHVLIAFVTLDQFQSILWNDCIF